MRYKRSLYLIICCLISISMFYQTAYAEEIDDSYEIDLNNKKGNHVGRNAYDQERNNLLGIENFKVSSNTALSKNNISFYKYSDLDGDFVSLREVIELIGGKVEWKGELPENSKFNYGYIDINNKKYEFSYSAKEDYVIDTKVTYISIYKNNVYGKEVLMCITGRGPLLGKVYGNTLLIPAEQIPCIFNRWGYIDTFDLKNNIFNEYKIDMIEENKKVKELLPETDAGSYYDSETIKYTTEETGYDIYSSINAMNTATYDSIHKYFDSVYKPYAMDTDYEARARLYYKATCLVDTDDENITVEYNKDLDCYIAYNNRCSKESPKFKMIAIRKFDGQVIYSYY